MSSDNSLPPGGVELPGFWRRILIRYEEPIKTWAVRLATWAAIAGVTWVIATLTGEAWNPPPFPQEKIKQAWQEGFDAGLREGGRGQGDEPGVGATGWIDDPVEVQAVLEQLPIREFDDTPAYKAAQQNDHVYLWEAAYKVLARPPPAKNQGGVGSCVAFGAATAVEYLMLSQIASGGQQEFHELSTEVIYGGSRVQIGGGRIRGDGSTGAWGARWVNEYGNVARGIHGQHDLRTYSESLCRQYGSRGVPADLIPIAKQSPVKGITLVRTAEQAAAALDSRYTISVASNQGFTMQRDSQGFCSPRGTWMHQMAILGYQRGARPGFWIQNSWGANAHTGPKGNGNPPDGGFWADWNVVDRMLRQGDSWAYSDAAGFPKRQIDWLVTVPRKPKPLRIDPRPEPLIASIAW